VSNPAWKKGMASPNPHGRGVAKASKPPGAIGVAAYAGYVSTGESSASLVGHQKWVTYSNSYHVPIIATGLRLYAYLLAGVDWHLDENEVGGADADRGVEIVQKGLLEAPMLKPWNRVVSKAGMYRPLGFSLHATAMRRRPDGLVVYSAIEHRPQHTIERWLRKDEFSPFTVAVQRTSETQKTVEIPLEECLYCVDDMFTDSPEGMGQLRHVIEYVRRLQLFERWEGDAYSGDLAGVPSARGPLAEIVAGMDDADAAKSKLDAATQVIRDFMTKRNKTPEQKEYLLLDSAPYANPDGTLSGVPKWEMDIFKTETANLDRIDATIRRVELQIARVLGIEFAMMGADGAGSYAQHGDKTDLFISNAETALDDIGWWATMQLARRLVAANGLDPDTACPRIVPEPISMEAIEVVTRALANLSLAGLAPDDAAIPVLRKRMRLPDPPERSEEMMAPRLKPPADDLTDPTQAGTVKPAEPGEDPTGADQTEAPDE
jgi:hypothetical protein